MRIPKNTAKPRFYVATSETTAFSSWDNLGKAVTSWQRLMKNNPEDATKVVGFIETGPYGKEMFRVGLFNDFERS